MLQDELEQWASAHFKHIQIIKRRWGTWDCYFLAALFSIWCLFRLCFLANFMFFKNFGSHPGNHNKNKIIKLKFLSLTLHAHVSLDGGFSETVAMILSALVMSGVVLTLGHSESRLFWNKQNIREWWWIFLYRDVTSHISDVRIYSRANDNHNV